MMFSDLRVQTPGKWILSGEHTVLRGGTAIVFPLQTQCFSLDYRAEDVPLGMHLEDGMPDTLLGFFWEGFHRALELLSISKASIKGRFSAYNTIPLASGMGGSAALCVNLAKWCLGQGLLPASELASFATELEHLYHGQSSGLDIAGVLSSNGIIYSIGDSVALESAWHPMWGISYCGEKGDTAQCIAQVNQHQSSNPKAFKQLDATMHQSSLDALQALKAPASTGREQLAQSMKQACSCFEQWGLISPALEQHITHLYTQGALACKPTGSGGGGYVVSLWEQRPPKGLMAQQPTLLQTSERTLLP